MWSLTCPRCRTTQGIPEGASGYTCRGCRTTWEFVTCTSCHTTWHVAAGTRSWTCKRCGQAHPPREEPETVIVSTGDAPGAPVRIPTPRRRARRPSLGDRWSGLAPLGKAVVVLVPLIVVAVVAFLLFSGGGGEKPAPTKQEAAARKALCHDLNQIGAGAFRVPRLTRLRSNLQADTRLYTKANDPVTVRAIADLQDAIGKLIKALQGHGSTVKASGGMQRALQALPSCR